jgi:hypothetical protein
VSIDTARIDQVLAGEMPNQPNQAVQLPLRRLKIFKIPDQADADAMAIPPPTVRFDDTMSAVGLLSPARADLDLPIHGTSTSVADHEMITDALEPLTSMRFIDPTPVPFVRHGRMMHDYRLPSPRIDLYVNFRGRPFWWNVYGFFELCDRASGMRWRLSCPICDASAASQ